MRDVQARRFGDARDHAGGGLHGVVLRHGSRSAGACWRHGGAATNQRFLRVRTGRFALGDLAPGQWRELTAAERAAVFA